MISAHTACDAHTASGLLGPLRACDGFGQAEGLQGFWRMRTQGQPCPMLNPPNPAPVMSSSAPQGTAVSDSTQTMPPLAQHARGMLRLKQYRCPTQFGK